MTLAFAPKEYVGYTDPRHYPMRLDRVSNAG